MHPVSQFRPSFFVTLNAFKNNLPKKVYFEVLVELASGTENNMADLERKLFEFQPTLRTFEMSSELLKKINRINLDQFIKQFDLKLEKESQIELLKILNLKHGIKRRLLFNFFLDIMSEFQRNNGETLNKNQLIERLDIININLKSSCLLNGLWDIFFQNDNEPEPAKKLINIVRCFFQLFQTTPEEPNKFKPILSNSKLPIQSIKEAIFRGERVTTKNIGCFFNLFCQKDPNERSHALKLYLGCGFNPNLMDSDHFMTPLMIFSSFGYMNEVELITRFGALVYYKSKRDQTAILFAACGGHTECLKYLIQKLKSQVDPETFRKTLDQPEISGYNALMYSVDRGFLECADLLLNEGANLNTMGYDSRTPLIIAVAKNDEKMVDLILANEKADLKYLEMTDNLGKDVFDYIQPGCHGMLDKLQNKMTLLESQINPLESDYIQALEREALCD